MSRRPGRAARRCRSLAYRYRQDEGPYLPREGTKGPVQGISCRFVRPGGPLRGIRSRPRRRSDLGGVAGRQGDGLLLEEQLQPLGAELPPEARLLVAAERGGEV